MNGRLVASLPMLKLDWVYLSPMVVTLIPSKHWKLEDKVKITDEFSAYGKWENIFQDSDDTRDWKVEVGTKYKF